MPVATLPPPATRRAASRRRDSLREPGTDYPRLGGLHGMGEILTRLAERLPESTADAFPNAGENDKLKAP
jgi:hypothetical protein